jgi:hypothetical protein
LVYRPTLRVRRQAIQGAVIPTGAGSRVGFPRVRAPLPACVSVAELAGALAYLGVVNRSGSGMSISGSSGRVAGPGGVMPSSSSSSGGVGAGSSGSGSSGLVTSAGSGITMAAFPHLAEPNPAGARRPRSSARDSDHELRGVVEHVSKDVPELVVEDEDEGDKANHADLVQLCPAQVEVAGQNRADDARAV